MPQSQAPVIIYIGGFELPDRNAATQRVLNNARVLRALGYRTVLVGVSRDRPFDGKLYPADAGGSGFEAWETGYPQTSLQWLWALITDAPLRSLPEIAGLDPHDVVAVICYNYPAVAQARIARLSRSWGSAAVADCTEWYGTRPWNKPANIIKNIDTALRMARVNVMMDGLITTSSFTTEYYRDSELPIVEIPTLVESPTQSAAEHAVFSGRGPISLFSIGPVLPANVTANDIHDRIDWVIDLLDGVAERGGRFVLKVAGIDLERYLGLFPHHSSKIERLGQAVQFLGRIPRSELLRLQEEAAFALIMRTDTRVTRAGFPTKFSEAISHGTPVIANYMLSLAPYHQEGKTGFLVELANRDRAIKKLMEILAMPDDAIMAMKRYCRECGIFSPSKFEPAVSRFVHALPRRR